MTDTMTLVLSQWSHALAAVSFAALGLWQIRLRARDRQNLILIVATLLTTLWALSSAITQPTSLISQVGEQARNAVWLAFMYMLWRRGEAEHRQKSVLAVYTAIAFVIVIALGLVFLPTFLSDTLHLNAAIAIASTSLRMIIAIGALVLLHNLYSAATAHTREAIALPMIALGMLWTYDLNLYVISYFTNILSGPLLALRGIADALVAMVFALAAQRTQNWNIRLSRRVTFQSLSLVGIGAYLIAIIAISRMIGLIAGNYAQALQVVFVFASSLTGLLLLPSHRFRAWCRVKIAKHLFQHRYDYRSEWLRFTDTLGQPGEQSMPLEARIVKAIADIAESPGGILLIPDESGSLILNARWNWKLKDPPQNAAEPHTGQWLCRSGRVVELDGVRNSSETADEDARHVPQWLITESHAWAMIPLVHFEKLAGVIVLERPLINRRFDWEDFDLLRTVGRQVASYLSEARSQESLSDAKQFDQFNRRFAFIMHDVKNLVSQLTLVTRNAERHASNPEFQADMILTLQNSAARMNDLLARLSQHNKAKPEAPRAIAAQTILESVAATRRAQHPIVISGNMAIHVCADPARLKQALSHFLQNAIDASAPNDPVTLTVRMASHEVAIDVVDAGHGMSQSFIREKLFKPFASSKEGGFGIGAYEAKTLIDGMGGRIEVISHEGMGSRFSILLPKASIENDFIPVQSVAA